MPSSFATVQQVVIANGAVGGGRAAFTGTFRRYVRIQRILDATSGSITWMTGYFRG